MRTTVSIDEELLARLEELAVRSGRTVTELVEDAVREMLARGLSGREPVRLRTARGSGPLPGVDLHGSASLLDRMERDA